MSRIAPKPEPLGALPKVPGIISLIACLFCICPLPLCMCFMFVVSVARLSPAEGKDTDRSESGAAWSTSGCSRQHITNCLFALHLPCAVVHVVHLCRVRCQAIAGRRSSPNDHRRRQETRRHVDHEKHLQHAMTQTLIGNRCWALMPSSMWTRTASMMTMTHRLRSRTY